MAAKDRFMIVGIYNYKIWFYNSNKNILISRDMNDVILDLLVSLECFRFFKRLRRTKKWKEFINYENI
jgi:hypothetical protein